MKALKKGDIVPLKYSKKARHRVICGLNWDPLEQGPGLLQKITAGQRNRDTYDLDLFCYMFDDDKDFADGVSGKPDETIDDSGNVYHSGDDTSGTGEELDDELVSVELRELPDYITHIVFVAEIQSDHSFADVLNPYIRVADGLTEQDLLIQDLRDGGDFTACVFARLFKNEGTWMLHYIGDYKYGFDIVDWIEDVKPYLSLEPGLAI
jgi:stress response protein SCP2